MKNIFLLSTLAATLLAFPALAEKLNQPASPLSLNTLNASVANEAQILNAIYSNPQFTKKLNELRASVGEDKALVVTAYAAHATRTYSTLVSDLGIYEVTKGVTPGYGRLTVRVPKNPGEEIVFEVSAATERRAQPAAQ